MRVLSAFVFILLLIGCATQTPRQSGPTREDLAKAELIAYRDLLREQVQQGTLTEAQAKYQMTQKVNEVVARLQAQEADQARLRMQAQTHQQQMNQNSRAERFRQQQLEYLRSLNSSPTNCTSTHTGGGNYWTTCR